MSSSAHLLPRGVAGAGARSHNDDAGATREDTPSSGVPGLVGRWDAREWMLDNLQVTGLVPMSTMDRSGRFTASLFLQGCPWVCPYCHNSTIIDPRIPGVVAWGTLGDLLARRRGLLDGVMFSDSEITRRITLGAAMACVREFGFGVSLHIAGPHPRRLKGLLGAGLVDWVDIDVKAIRGNYEAMARRSSAGEQAWESLNIILAHPEVDHEVHLTIYPDGPGNDFEVAARARETGVGIFALQQARDMGTPDSFPTTRPGWDDQVRSLAQGIGALDFERFVFRKDS